MRKVLGHIASVITLLSVSLGAFAAGEVQLLNDRSNECPPVSGCFGSTFLNATIEVKNIAYAKQVGIRYKNSAGAWVNAPAQYFMPSNPGKEIWNISLPETSDSYAIYYTVNGVTYWDNNNGKNYSNAHYRYDAQLGTAIGDVQGFWNPAANGNPAAITGDLLVKNMGTNKVVKAVYTEDNWVTTKVAYATFKATLPSGIEYWTFSLPTAATVTTSKVKLAFQYTWNGGSEWDNSFGKNYGLHSQYFIARN